MTAGYLSGCVFGIAAYLFCTDGYIVTPVVPRVQTVLPQQTADQIIISAFVLKRCAAYDGIIQIPKIVIYRAAPGLSPRQRTALAQKRFRPALDAYILIPSDYDGIVILPQ